MWAAVIGITAACLGCYSGPNLIWRPRARLPLRGPTLTPLRGWIESRHHPRLAPWAAFFRRSAAGSVVTLFCEAFCCAGCGYGFCGARLGRIRGVRSGIGGHSRGLRAPSVARWPGNGRRRSGRFLRSSRQSVGLECMNRLGARLRDARQIYENKRVAGRIPETKKLRGRREKVAWQVHAEGGTTYRLLDCDVI